MRSLQGTQNAARRILDSVTALSGTGVYSDYVNDMVSVSGHDAWPDSEKAFYTLGEQFLSFQSF